MSRTSRGALGTVAVLAVLLGVGGCSSSPKESASTAVSATTKTGNPTAGQGCAVDLADPLEGMDRKTRARRTPGKPTVTEVHYQNANLSRGVSLVATWDSAAYGDGLPGPTADATVNGQDAVIHEPSPDTDVYTWTDASSPLCPQLALTLIGLTAEESDRVLASLVLK